MDHTHQRQEESNKNGGPEAKGCRAPQVVVAQPQPVTPAKVPVVAQQ